MTGTSELLHISISVVDTLPITPVYLITQSVSKPKQGVALSHLLSSQSTSTQRPFYVLILVPLDIAIVIDACIKFLLPSTQYLRSMLLPAAVSKWTCAAAFSSRLHGAIGVAGNHAYPPTAGASASSSGREPPSSPPSSGPPPSEPLPGKLSSINTASPFIKLFKPRKQLMAACQYDAWYCCCAVLCCAVLCCAVLCCPICLAAPYKLHACRWV